MIVARTGKKPSKRNPIQHSFFTHDAFKDFARTAHGGDTRLGKRKLMRPLSAKKSIHIVIRASKARGPLSMLLPKNKNRVENILFHYANRSGVKIQHLANSGNHLHILLRGREVEGIQKFLRTVCGLIPRALTGARKGKPMARSGDASRKFWDSLAFTRVVQPGRDQKNTIRYLMTNTIESRGNSMWAYDLARELARVREIAEGT